MEVHVFTALRLLTGRYELELWEFFFFLLCTIQASWSSSAMKVLFLDCNCEKGSIRWAWEGRGCVPSERHWGDGIVGDTAHQLWSILAIVGMFSDIWKKLWVKTMACCGGLVQKHELVFCMRFLFPCKMDVMRHMSKFHWEICERPCVLADMNDPDLCPCVPDIFKNSFCLLLRVNKDSNCYKLGSNIVQCEWFSRAKERD